MDEQEHPKGGTFVYSDLSLAPHLAVGQCLSAPLAEGGELTMRGSTIYLFELVWILPSVAIPVWLSDVHHSPLVGHSRARTAAGVGGIWRDDAGARGDRYPPARESGYRAVDFLPTHEGGVDLLRRVDPGGRSHVAGGAHALPNLRSPGGCSTPMHGRPWQRSCPWSPSPCGPSAHSVSLPKRSSCSFHGPADG